MFDLKQQFEQYQNDSTTITFETGNTIDNFLTNCTINDYERDFETNMKEFETELFENAKNGPVSKFYEKKRQADESELTTQKRKWMNGIRIGGGYQYGIIDNNTAFSDKV